MDRLPIAVRHARETDLPFLVNSYVRCLSTQRPWGRPEQRDAYMLNGRNLLDKNWAMAASSTLCRAMLSQATVLVACGLDDPDQIYGWVAGDPERRVLGWIYTKSAFRGLGVGGALMRAMYGDVGKDAEPILCCHDTAAYGRRKAGWHLRFNSHMLAEWTKDAG
jgi:GNAT superfamily N-acetyltransferase